MNGAMLRTLLFHNYFYFTEIQPIVICLLMLALTSNSMKLCIVNGATVRRGSLPAINLSFSSEQISIIRLSLQVTITTKTITLQIRNTEQLIQFNTETFINITRNKQIQSHY